ncbi:AAA family ATPase [Nannocystis sp.]|uniref:AAA family ATPase n=1 Tax=Nannocystis sp. TaxID=1962667 RepID=UPI0025E1799D|nr:AAA family ATPase [Nannocystis sp.]
MKLKHLKIHQYRNVRPGTELRFDDGINLVLGQNGSGKTTLLGLISCVASNDLSPLKSEVFDIEYTLDADPFLATFRISNLAAGDDSRGPQEPAFKYDVRLARHDVTAKCTITGTPSETTVFDGSKSHLLPSASPFRVGFLFPNFVDRASPFHAAPPRLLLPDLSRFDESLDAYLAMTGRAPVSQNAGAPAIAKVDIVQTGEHITPRRSTFFPLDTAPLVPLAHKSPAGELWVTPEPDASVNRPGLKFLGDVAALIGFRSATWAPLIRQSKVPPSGGSRSYEVQGSAFTFTRHNGDTIDQDLLSYGQKRLLAFYYYLATAEHFVIADELVNGLHHRWIAACMEAIGDRQAFLTSQNPLLFEYVEFDSIEQVQSCFINCKSELVDGAEQLVWQNMPRDDAERFYRGYEADIESIGDILINRGLW